MREALGIGIRLMPVPLIQADSQDYLQGFATLLDLCK